MRKISSLAVALATVVATLPGAAQATSTTCSTSVVCSEYLNTYSGASGGVAIHGEANGGIGVRGTSVANTGFYGASGSGSSLTPGVEGESTNNTGSDAAGAFGLAYETGGTNAYGVEGYGAKYGVVGTTSTASYSLKAANFGVIGFDNFGSSSFNAAVGGVSTRGVGVLAESNGTPTLGSVSQEPIGVYAVAEPSSGPGPGFPGAVAVEAESTMTALEAQNTEINQFVDLADGQNLIAAGADDFADGYFTVDDSANISTTGTLTTKATYVRTAGTSGTARVAYGTRSTAPEIEDVGEGNLVDGRAVVSIDPALADTIDMRRAYHVFITPEGDCKGLYVTQKTPGSFVVRELQGGRSTLAFDYRIVAKPHDENGARLALAPALERPTPALTHRNSGASAGPQSPDAQLKAQLGPAGYARALSALKARFSGR